MPTPRVRVYLACSLDGFIAGPDNDLAWLEHDYSAPGGLAPEAGALRFDAFMAEVGALLMGRTTYDVVTRLSVWPYATTPVVVATRRPLLPTRTTVRASQGPIRNLVAEAAALAGDKDVYLDGGELVRQALDAGLVDEMTLTLVPILLTKGTRLFDGLASRTGLHFVAHHAFDNGMVQVTARKAT